jgi:hypothetical protein
MASELVGLQREAEALGIKVDGRWGVDRLRAEIDAAAADETDEPEPEEAPADDEPDEAAADDEPEPETDESTALRAGGHIDRGDGRGWMLEQ